jgi:cytochrome c6
MIPISTFRRTQLKRIFVSIIAFFLIFSSLVTPPALAADSAHGKQLFGANCASCHAGGKNVVNPQKTLSGADLNKNGKDSLEAIIAQITKGAGAMPAFGGGRLAAADIADIASYVLETSQKGW